MFVLSVHLGYVAFIGLDDFGSDASPGNMKESIMNSFHFFGHLILAVDQTIFFLYHWRFFKVNIDSSGQRKILGPCMNAHNLYIWIFNRL